MRKGKIVVFISLLIISLSTCQKKNPHGVKLLENTSIQNYFDVLSANKDFSGVLLVGNTDSIIGAYTSGYSDFENNKAHTLNSKFCVASISKSLTAASILLLKEQGKIKLSDTINSYLPNFKHGNKITILNLLRFESGLDEIDWEKNHSNVLSAEELVVEIGKKPLLFEPGTNGKYGNAGFNVLARIIEVISGKSYDSFLKEELLKHYEISNTGDLSTQNLPNLLSTPHFPGPYPKLLESITDVNYSLSLGSGSVYSTATDLWKWGNTILSKEPVNVFKEEYPYGWGRDSIAGKFCLNQTGMNNGFVSSVLLFPEEQITMVLLSNIENGLWVDWSKDLAKLYFNDSSSISYPELRSPEYGVTLNLDAYTGRYLFSEERFVDVKNNEGHLYIYLNEFYKGHHLLPKDEDRFELRSYTGMIRFKTKDTMLWKLPEQWGGETQVYLKE